jgi:hypothetical protein
MKRYVVSHLVCATLLLSGAAAAQVYQAGSQVGIGWPTPTFTLHVGASDRAFRVEGPANGSGILASFGGHGRFEIDSFGTYGGRFLVTDDGNVGIGVTDPGAYKLAVNGGIRAKEVVVETGWPDFVFADDYQLPALEDVEGFIRANRHLPGIPSEAEVLEHGVKVGEMQSKLLQKVEELTLYTIELQKRHDLLQERLARLERR